MNKLTDKYYDAVVVSDEIDPNHGGAVRVMVIGVTDSLKTDDQPFVIPAVNNIQAVPVKGTVLRVAFDDGDINKGKYFQSSPESSYLPKEYVDDYPNIAVANLGGDLFQMSHNRRTRETLITHPSNSSITWSSTGAIIHNSDKGYNNTGQGALNNQGTRIHPILTEATIDVFCCTPVGNNVDSGGTYQGSEYFFATHMSNTTANALNNITNDDFDTIDERNPSKELGGSELESFPIFNTNGELIENIDFYPIETYIERDSKEFTQIVIVNSSNNNFLDIASKVIDNTNDFGVHYLIGRSPGTPPIDSARDGESNETEKGLLQFVELSNDVSYMSNVRMLDNRNLNVGSVFIMLISDGQTYTDYQYEVINKLITHIRFISDDNDLPVIIQSPINMISIPPVEDMVNFDIKRILSNG